MPEYQTEIENLDDINIQIEKVRQKIQSFGDVNPLALEAYAEMKERYDTIVQQRNDIITSRDSLMETIDEIEVTATKMYLDSFEQIRTNSYKYSGVYLPKMIHVTWLFWIRKILLNLK